MNGTNNVVSAGEYQPAPREAITALIIDDESHARMYLRMVLRSLGVTNVWEVANGREAIALCATLQPSLIFLDNNMPVLSGKRAIKELRKVNPDAVIIVVTADNDVETVRYYLEHGATNYVLKHSDRSVVTSIIADVLADFILEPSETAACGVSN